MIALDTNVLVRLITRDDVAQAAAVDALLSTPDELFFLPDLVLAELASVLTRGYAYARVEVAQVMSALLDRVDVVFENEERVRTAVRMYVGGLDLADALILGKAREEGCSALASLDEALCRADPGHVSSPLKPRR